MKTLTITIVFFTLTSICAGQFAKKDTASIYWPNKQLKYRSICCFADTLDSTQYIVDETSPYRDEPVVVALRSQEMWDEKGNEIYVEDYLKNHKDIVVLEEEVGIGEDEKEYRNLISIADSVFSLMDIANNNSVNRVISSYVKAEKKNPDALYPKQKLQEILELRQ